MKNFIYLNKSHVNQIVKHRHGETKLGESIDLVSSIDDLKTFNQQYVIIGLPEDIGVQANHGNGGTSKAWQSFLNAFLNIQNNRYNSPDNVIILGHLNFDKYYKNAEDLDPSHNDYHVFLGDIVEQIDNDVFLLVERILSSGKTPIIIGGGHNNAYGIIKGCSKNAKKAVNVLNIDAHTDLRQTEYRHSGNGFSYALQHNFLDKYFIFGLHKNYTPEPIFNFIDKKSNISFCCLDQMLHLNQLEKLSKLKAASNFLMNDFGLEIDCDSIQNFNSSAVSPSGFSIDEIRNMIKMLKNNPLKYVHICEAIPSLTNGKALSYFVSDLIRNEC